MAYEKQIWNTGDIITAEKLNHIEEGISEGGNVGYEMTTTTVFEGDITTTDDAGSALGIPTALGLVEVANPIDAEKIEVIFNGQRYECQKSVINNTNGYGGMTDTGLDWTEYPFTIGSDTNRTALMTENAGTYSVKISVFTAVTTPEFDMAVNKAIPAKDDSGVFYINVEDAHLTIVDTITPSTIISALAQKKSIVLRYFDATRPEGEGQYYPLTYGVAHNSSGELKFFEPIIGSHGDDGNYVKLEGFTVSWSNAAGPIQIERYQNEIMNW